MKMTNIDLTRFVKAQEQDYETALSEIIDGEKKTHWMWYIFPQLVELGYSPTARYYGVKNLEEARAFLKDPYLGGNLRQISRELLKLETNNPEEVLGPVDALKLKSSMTLFSRADAHEPVFKEVLNKYYEGIEDQKTIELLD